MINDRLKSRLEEADALREKAHYRQSLSIVNRALKTCGPRDFEGAYRCHLLSGHNWRMLGNFEKAIAHYEKAISFAGGISPADISLAEGAKTLLPDATVSLSLAYRALGDWKEALSLLREAEKAYKRLKDEEALAFVLWSKGGTFRIKGDIGRAIETLLEARKMFAALGDEHAVGFCLNGLGGANRIKGAYKTSLACYTKANTLFKKLKDP
nr:tetratricopeptide repeat protein [Nitrospiraceae bacterium]